jgi:hypothetical protein
MKRASFSNIERCSDGLALFFAVLTASLVLTIGLALFNITLKEFVLSSQIRDSQFAFYAADSGLECALYWDLAHPGYEGSIFGSYSNTISDGLVAYWKFDDGTGSDTAVDTSGNGHAGTLTNVDPANDWVTGKIGRGLDFDGTANKVDIGNSAPLNLTTYTYSFWIYPQAGPTGSFRQILIKGAGGVVNERAPGIWLRPNDMGLHVMHSTASGGQVGVLQSSALSLDTWTHVVVTSSGDSGTIVVYIDGEPDTTSPHTETLVTNTSSLKIGASTFTSADMLIDEVRVYDRVLSDVEIESLFTLTAPAIFVGPIGAESNVSCVGQDISATANDWTTTTNDPDATTTFSIFSLGGADRCARVTVAKTNGATRIESRGYNSCDTNNPRRIERALRATY